MNRNQLVVPELKHDAMMLAQYGREVSANGRMERRIVAALCGHLKERGFEPIAVFDGEERTKTSDAKSVMELVFNLDEASVRFKKAGHSEHGVLLMLGEGDTIITDWNYTEGDPDGFDAAMEAFHVEDFL